MGEIETIISRLKIADPAIRIGAERDLANLSRRGMSEQEGMDALRAAAEPFPVVENRQDAAESLVQATMSAKPRQAYVPVIGELFEKYTAPARTAALWILIRNEEHAAAETFVRLVDKYGPELSIVPIGSLEQNPRQPELFLRLLPLMRHDRIAASIAFMLLGFNRKKLVSRDQLLDCETDLLGAYRKRREKMMPRQQEGFTWMWEDDYVQWRSEAGVFLDLMGHIPTSDVRKELHAAMSLRDPVPKVFAIRSLLILGEEVNAQDVADVAIFPEERCLLFDVLKKFKQLDLVPPKFITQAMLAEAKMVKWLIYPTELGRPPDEMELMKIITVDTRNGPGDYFLFQFRTLGEHWAAKDGWMAAVTGPYLRNQQPTTTGAGDTFSKFAKWDSMTPEEHVEEIRKLIGASWKIQVKKVKEERS